MADITYCACSCANCSGCTGYEPEPTAIERAAAMAALVQLRAKLLTPSADVPACWDEDPAQPATLAACYPDPPEYPHPEDEEGARLAERDSYIGTWSDIDITKRRTNDE